MTLSLYILRSYLTAVGTVFGIVVALVLTVDTIDVLGSIRSEKIGFLDAIWLSSLRVPDILVTVLPLVVLISSMVFCMTMSASSEFIVARAIGRPMLSTLTAPLLLTMVIAIMVACSFGPLSGRLFGQFDNAKAQFSTDIESRLQVTASGLWLREARDDQITVLNAATSYQSGDRLFDVTIFRFNTEGRLIERLEAQNGFLSQDELILTNVKIWDFTKLADNPELSAQNRGLMRIPTTLTSAQVRDGQPEPRTLFIWDLPRAIAALEKSGSSSLAHRIHFSSQLAMPIYYAAMFLIGACFSLYTSRFGRRGLAVIGAVTLGFFLFFFQRTSQTFGEAGELPLLVATWSTPLAGFLGGLAWLLRKEDG